MSELRESVKKDVLLLVEKYDKVVKENRVNKYREEETKKDFILPLFRALGWNVEDSSEVSAEEKISKKRVDYGFRINGIPKFFLETKSLSEDLDKPKFFEQAVNYSWHKGCTWAVLTNFKSVKILNAELKTANYMQSSLKTVFCSEFLNRFDELWLLSKESFEQGLIDKEAEKWGKRTRKISVDKQLLTDFTRFRELLSQNITKLNQSKNITEEDLDEAIQRILDRLIFIRNCEDRELEAKILISNMREWESGGKGHLIKSLREVFAYFDKEYNSKIFAKHLCDDLEVDNEVLHEIIEGLYYTRDRSISYDFSVIDADVLGSVYEQYLGHVLRKTEKRAKLTESHAHRKEQGIYYTPTYIVDYIVRNTLGELLKDNKIDVEKTRILDPACGSGSFLIKAFDVLNEYHLKNDKDYSQTQLDFETDITFTRKVKILQNNIFGVDLDKQAVEIAQLNLLLKIAEKGHRLPILEKNIKNGNSLIDDETIAGNKAFKWKEEFDAIMNEGGFDVVIGNPPYINNRNLPKQEKEFFEKHYSTAYQQYDIYVLFYEVALKLLKIGGYLGFITPNKFAITKYGIPLRKLLLNYKIVKIIDVSQLGVFAEASTYPYIVIIQKISPMDNKLRFYTPKSSNFEKMGSVEIKQSSLNGEKPFIFNANKEEISILDKVSGENLIDIYRAKPTTKSLSEKGNAFAITNREVERYNLVKGSKRIEKKIEWIIEIPAILMKKICFVPTASILRSNDMIPVNTVYVIHSQNREVSLEYLLGVLNSKLIGYYTRKRYGTTAMRGGFIELRTFEIEQIPVKVSPEYKQTTTKLVSKMLSLNKRLNEIGDKRTDEWARIEEEIKKTDLEIDELVYEIYGITEAEKKIIEESLK
jgi:type I restriction-modification system DNA methylase subunit